VTTELSIAQISDCHLFSDFQGEHYGANVFQNLSEVLLHIQSHQLIDAIVFTGDLTQDHTERSYQNFVHSIKQHSINRPVYFVPGNHDDVVYLNKYLVGNPFDQNKVIESKHWQILLLNSKSDTPSGKFKIKEFEAITSTLTNDKFQFCFMHHHPIDVGYFIDRHGLINKSEFWAALGQHGNMKGVACGHVHQGIDIDPESNHRAIPLHTCPATSMQFAPLPETAEALSDVGAGYRMFKFKEDGSYTTDIFYL